MSTLLEVENISKSFGHNEVLKNISFKVSSGSIVGFIGDNGAGKSTTFKTILGLVSKDSGTIKIFDQEHIDKNVKLKEKIGVVFDAINLPTHLTIKQLNHVFKRIFDSWDETRFSELIRSFSLPVDQKLSKFSRGMSMKLSVAVALSHHAQLLMLDEATGGLDPSSREELLNELQTFASTNDGGILLSSHIMSDVEKIATHIVIIKNGEILLSEEKGKVFKEYAILNVNEEQIQWVPNDIIIAKRTQESHIAVLVSDRERVPDKLSAVSNITLEEMSVLLTRSDE